MRLMDKMLHAGEWVRSRRIALQDAEFGNGELAIVAQSGNHDIPSVMRATGGKAAM
jgi:hypothetical protein